MTGRLAAAALLFVACYSPGIRDGQFTCEHTGQCPSGFSCVCNVCRSPGASTTCADLSLGSTDLAASDLMMSMPMPDMATLPGCSAGPRAPIDPGLARVALCPAAWAAPGTMSTSTPCNRNPGPTGMSGSTACTTEDNCAPGWHVCADDTELSSRGFDTNHCIALNSVAALFVTRQPGGPPPSPGPAVCGGTQRAVFGCGMFGQIPAAGSCAVVQKVLLNPPDTVDDCSTATQGAFTCGTAMVAEAASVTKLTREKGGVICCM